MMAISSMLSPLASSMVAPALPKTLLTFPSSPTVGTLSISIFLIGYTLGPLFLAPLSEVYGRVRIVNAANTFLVISLMACALAPSMGALITFRVLAGLGGSAVMVTAPAIAADLYPVEKRGGATAVVVLCQCAGPAIGPICGGFIADAIGWRWIYWILAIALGLTTASMVLWMHESYAPEVLKRKCDKLKKEMGRDDLKPRMNLNMPIRQLLLTSLVRPTKVCRSIGAH